MMRRVVAALVAALVLSAGLMSATPAEAAPVGCRVWATSGIRAGAASICDGKGGANRWHRPHIWCKHWLGYTKHWIGDWQQGRRTSSVKCDYFASLVRFGVETYP